MRKPITSVSHGIACVTGGTGLVGGWIVQLLLEHGWQVRVLTRQKNVRIEGAEVFSGDLNNISLLENFVEGSKAIFHCAAELQDETRMHRTNVEGTKNLLTAMEGKGIAYFCHLSSVGVMGANLSGVVDEETSCSPIGAYEKSKLEAESLVHMSSVCDKIIVLRPTNVVGFSQPGILQLSRGSVVDRLRFFLKGAENAHLVHARDVAGAALYFLNKAFHGIHYYIVSLDEQAHTIGEVCTAFRTLGGKKKFPQIYLPWRMLYLIRKAYRGASLRGDIVFSSSCIRKNGYKFTYDLEALLRDVAGQARRDR